MKKGIVDPWRVVEPLTPPARPVGAGRKNLDDIDRDADLAIPGRYTIRTRHSCIDIVHLKVTSANDALELLIGCLFEGWKLKPFADAMIAMDAGIRCPAGTRNAPRTDAQTSSLSGTAATLWFSNKTLDQGMLELTKLLRRPIVANLIKKWGINPMLNG